MCDAFHGEECIVGFQICLRQNEKLIIDSRRYLLNAVWEEENSVSIRHWRKPGQVIRHIEVFTSSADPDAGLVMVLFYLSLYSSFLL